jgi:hypothetical protein
MIYIPFGGGLGGLEPFIPGEKQFMYFERLIFNKAIDIRYDKFYY